MLVHPSDARAETETLSRRELTESEEDSANGHVTSSACACRKGAKRATASPRSNRRLYVDLFLFARTPHELHLLTLISSARKVYLEQLSVAVDGSFAYKLHNTPIGITIVERCFRLIVSVQLPNLSSWRRFLSLSFILTFVSWNCERDQRVADGVP